MPAQNQSKRKLLADLYYGHSGKHLTAYIPDFSGEIHRLKEHLQRVLNQSRELLGTHQSPEFIDQFLSPICHLLDDPSLLLSSGHGGWVLLRTPKSFRIKKTEDSPPAVNVISDSFHVKPFLKWTQSSKNFYLLAIHQNEAGLFQASSKGLKNLGSLRLLPEFFESSRRDRGDKISQRRIKMAAVDWIDDWVMEQVGKSSWPLLLAGQKSFLNVYRSLSKYPFVTEEFIYGNFTSDNHSRLEEAAKKLLQRIVKKEKAEAKRQLKREVHQQRVELKLDRIAKEAVRGTVKRLYVAEDAYIWGLIRKSDGALTIRDVQRDCHDEDILDDLAETVLSKGGDVIVLPHKDMPDQLAAAAVLYPSQPLVLLSENPKVDEVEIDLEVDQEGAA